MDVYSRFGKVNNPGTDMGLLTYAAGATGRWARSAFGHVGGWWSPSNPRTLNGQYVAWVRSPRGVPRGPRRIFPPGGAVDGGGMSAFDRLTRVMDRTGDALAAGYEGIERSVRSVLGGLGYVASDLGRTVWNNLADWEAVADSARELRDRILSFGRPSISLDVDAIRRAVRGPLLSAEILAQQAWNAVARPVGRAYSRLNDLMGMAYLRTMDLAGRVGNFLTAPIDRVSARIAVSRAANRPVGYTFRPVEAAASASGVEPPPVIHPNEPSGSGFFRGVMDNIHGFGSGFSRGLGAFGAWTRNEYSPPSDPAGRAGFYAGMGAAGAGVLLAGSAIYSGVSNLRRGSYGRALLNLLAGTALVGGLVYANYYGR